MLDVLNGFFKEFGFNLDYNELAPREINEVQKETNELNIKNVEPAALVSGQQQVTPDTLEKIDSTVTKDLKEPSEKNDSEVEVFSQKLEDIKKLFLDCPMP